MDARLQVPIHASSFRNKTKKRRSRYRRTRAGRCAAAVRGVTGARLYLDHKVPSLAAAALCCGSCRTYVQAALILLRSENATMLERVLRGHLPLQVAAKQMKQVADLVAAYRTADAADRVAFAKTIGPTTLFDSALVPAI
jgi:hypothetical protein